MERGLDERREPLLLVPVPEAVPGDLPEAHDDSAYARAARNILEEALRDPLRLGVAAPEGRLRVRDGDLGDGSRELAVYWGTMSARSTEELRGTYWKRRL